MAFDRNFVLIVGNLTADPELRYTPNGQAVASFTLATNRSYKDKTTDEWNSIAEYHRCVAWGKAGEIISGQCGKGEKLHVEGRLQTRKWEDRSGQTKYMTEIIVEDFIIYNPQKKNAQPKPPMPKEMPEGVKEANTSDEDLEKAASEAFGMDDQPTEQKTEKTGIEKVREQAEKIKQSQQEQLSNDFPPTDPTQEVNLDDIPF